VCERSESSEDDGARPRQRRLVPWKELDARTRRHFQFDDGKKSEVTPIRFVGACEKGHVQDINWRWAIHGEAGCAEPMFMEERGTSASPADTSVVCGCKKRLSLEEAFRPGRLGRCEGRRPWLLDRDPDACGDNLKLLTRTATNTYFAQVDTVISLPSAEDELTKLVAEFYAELTPVTSLQEMAQARKFIDKVRFAFEGWSDADIFDRLTRIREGALSDATGSAKPAEFDVFACGRAEIGENHPTAKLYARTLPRQDWAHENVGVDLSAIRAVVAVHRLREVSCLYGFTRFEPAPTLADVDMEDVHLAVRGAPLARHADWLPAIEQFGEGIFIHFDPEAIRTWLSGDAVAKRADTLLTGFEFWKRRFDDHPPRYPGTPYVLLHSLSHALMAEISLECGYPASSLKERVYSEPSTHGGEDFTRCGILIYTATAGAQGTLGGLVATSTRFAAILRGALDRLAICSNDPVCADHMPDERSGDRATHGAACHGCLLISETSCEKRNLFLDRSLLVPTMSQDGAEFFL
jgi:hypothetical protein